MNSNFKQTIPILLTLLGLGGTGVLVYEVAKTAPKVKEKIDKTEEELGRKLTKKERIKLAYKDYIPSAAIFAGVAGCEIGAAALSKKQTTSLAAAYALTENAYRKYKDKAIKLFGDKVDKEILADECADEMAKMSDEEADELCNKDDGKKLYWDEFNGFYRANPEKIREAELEMNKRLVNYEPVPLVSFYAVAEVEISDVDKIRDLGWSVPQFDWYSYEDFFIDFRHYEHMEVEGRDCTVISFLMPYSDYIEAYEDVGLKTPAPFDG